MKLIHLSDLHLGKRLNGFSLLEDQEYILSQITKITEAERPDGVIIAGDIYDKSAPSAESVALFDKFLSSISSVSPHVFIVSGNHDSAERIAFGCNIMNKSGVHLSPVYNGSVTPVTLCDSFGDVNIYMLPFVKPANVRSFFPNEEINNYTDAVSAAVKNMGIDTLSRNVLVTHQFVTGASLSESEDISVGGSDNVDGGVFDSFDYVALGHIHSPQNVGNNRIRYCGTPLKYSFSECSQNKSLTVVNLGEKGQLDIAVIPLIPLRDMREIRGSYNEVTAKSSYQNTNTDDYLHITLTDEDYIPDAVIKLRTIYPNLMKLSYDNARTRFSAQIDSDYTVKSKDPLTIFCEFYQKQNNQPIGAEQRELLIRLIENIWEGEK